MLEKKGRFQKAPNRQKKVTAKQFDSMMQKQKKAWLEEDAWRKKTKQSTRSRCDDSRVCPEEHENWIWWLGMLEHQEGLKTTRVFLVKDEAEGGGQCSQATQAVITVLQVLVTLVAAGVPRGVSCEATPVQEQLLLWASRLAAPLWVAAACRVQHHQKGAVTSYDQEKTTGEVCMCPVLLDWFCRGRYFKIMAWKYLNHNYKYRWKGLLVRNSYISFFTATSASFKNTEIIFMAFSLSLS